MGTCKLCEPEKYFIENGINRVLIDYRNCYVAIPLEPAMRGHLIVVSKYKPKGKHIEDITEIKNEKQREVLCEMIKVSAIISQALKKWDESIRKVYILCEGETPHLHFHLKPRREGEEMGDLFLFEKEIEESRWVLNPENESEAQSPTLEKGIGKIKKGIALAEKHETLIKIDKWLKSKKKAQEFYKDMIKELKPFVTEAIESLDK